MSRMGSFTARLVTRFWLSRCARGSHARLIWLRAEERRVPIPTHTPRLNPVEAFYASGMGQFALWNGWCPRCGQAVEWADHDPIRFMEDDEAIAAYAAAIAWRDSERKQKAAR